ncbi:MarR family transcriptional regulator [Marinicella sp. W31]|uniref:MarR family transcriptional regulator n=1 Tax=Marinicella sp. W31 TaxID=3023713 RepID=UPI00375678E4
MKKAESILNLYREIIFCHYHLQAYGKKLGAITPKGLAIWNLLISIQEDENSTIAKIAKKRSVSRQFIQKNIKTLVDDNLVKFIDNPLHKKSKLLKLTEKGSNVLTKINTDLLIETEKIADDFTFDLNNLSKSIREMNKILIHQIK